MPVHQPLRNDYVATVAVLVFPPVSVFEMAVAAEVWGLDRSSVGVPRHRLFVCTPDGPALLPTNGGGFAMQVGHDLRVLRRADTIVCPGWARPFQEPIPETVGRELRRAADRGARIASFCSGVHVLASAGLLDGKRAATHWNYRRALAERHPQVEFVDDLLYIDDGSGICTSAGTGAAIDLCLHLVRSDFGAEVANTVARRMVMPPHRTGTQAQYIESPGIDALADVSDAGVISDAMNWALRHLRDELTVAQLARRANQSQRTFARHFRDVTGTTPLQWILAQRVLAAQRLLETTDLSVERIASRVGLGTAANLRIHFARVVGTSPFAYRRTFRETG
jgi:AraC family transcriptional regulator, transcriptional activator FtrA